MNRFPIIVKYFYFKSTPFKKVSWIGFVGLNHIFDSAETNSFWNFFDSGIFNGILFRYLSPFINKALPSDIVFFELK